MKVSTLLLFSLLISLLTVSTFSHPIENGGFDKQAWKGSSVYSEDGQIFIEKAYENPSVQNHLRYLKTVGGGAGSKDAQKRLLDKRIKQGKKYN